MIVVFASPEIALKKRFAEGILRAPEFSQKLCLLAIDEMHVVEEWSGFRPAYLQLAVLRSRLAERVPLLGASATLTDELVDELRVSCGFRRATHVVKTPLDWPEIYLQVTPAKYPMNGMLDLQHLLPDIVSSPQDIPKTIVFVDSCATAANASKLLAEWMADLGYPIESVTGLNLTSHPWQKGIKKQYHNDSVRFQHNVMDPVYLWRPKPTGWESIILISKG